MRVLVLTPSLPYPLHQGGALRNYGILCGLHDAGHEVTLLSFHDDAPPAHTTPLAGLCVCIETAAFPARNVAHRLRDLILTGYPDLVRRLYSPAFEARLSSLLRATPFDLVQFEGLEMAAYASSVRTQQPEARLCYDAHNAEYELQRAIYQVDRVDFHRWPAAIYSLIQSQRIARFEAALCREADCVIAVSDEDAGLLRKFRKEGSVSVVPNGIFADDYRDVQEQLDLGANVLVFTGKMDYRPNVDAIRWFASDILPKVQDKVPDVRLYVVGQKPHIGVETLREKPNIAITGWVSDVRPYLHAADVYIAPLRMGSGTRLKILEAMAAGCAVVATSHAASGLTNGAEDAMIVQDDPGSLAEAIISLLHNPTRRQELGEAARAYAKQHYDWTVLIPRLLAAYRDIGLG